MSYLKNIFTTGATGKTPQRILKRIISEVKGIEARSIIELGAGKGEITELVLKELDITSSKYDAFEINREFAAKIKKSYPGVYVHAENALNFDKYAPGGADLIICSLPLSFFPKLERNTLYKKMKTQLNPGGKAIILFHAFWLIRPLLHIFRGAKLITQLHFPLYHILVYHQHGHHSE